MRHKSNRVLMFSSRTICYSSSNFFAHQLAVAYEKMGFEAEVCELSKEDDLDEKLKPLLEKEYRVIVDFNSLLPRMQLEDGSAYVDRLEGPFFDYILDHPLFHYAGLNSGVKNMRAILLDEAQEEYVKKYYRKVPKTYTLPLGATKAVYDGEKEKDVRILFTGTYDTPESVYAVVEASPEPIRTMMKRLIEKRMAMPLIPMEKLFEEELLEQDLHFSTEEFATFMNGMYAVDAYVRDYFRKVVLDELLNSQIPVTVVGEGWEKYSHSNISCLKKERSVTFGRSFERIAKAHILLNVAPIFNHGMHDRIIAGMANHTVVLTDENPYLKKCFTDGEDVAFYALDDLKSVSKVAEKLIGSQKYRETLANNAYHVFTKHHTWERRAKQILDWADMESNE